MRWENISPYLTFIDGLRASHILSIYCPNVSLWILTVDSNGFTSTLSDLSGKLPHSVHFVLDSCWNPSRYTAEIVASDQLQVLFFLITQINGILRIILTVWAIGMAGILTNEMYLMIVNMTLADGEFISKSLQDPRQFQFLKYKEEYFLSAASSNHCYS